MLDIIVPCVKKELADLADHVGYGLVQNLNEQTDVKFRIVVSVSGVRRNDLGLVEAALGAGAAKWAIVESSPTIKPMNFMVQQAVEHCRHKFVAVCKPGTIVDDKQWFGKMQVPFLKEPRCYIVGTDPSVQSIAMHPARQRGNTFADLGPLALIKRSAIDDMKFEDVDGTDWIEKFGAAAVKSGGTVWMAPGVRVT